MRVTALALLVLLIAVPAVADVSLGNGVTLDDEGSIHYPNGDVLHPDGSWTTAYEPFEEDGPENTEGDDNPTGGMNDESGHGSSNGGRGPK